jgi:NAD(P)-dependent dehydrogenase (short-subunit alcohol dehydrogenase family)
LGAAVVVLDFRSEACETVAKQLENEYGIPTLPLIVDLEDEQALRNVPAIISERLGRLDIVINCAALVGTSKLEGWTTPFKEQSANTWRLAQEINVTAPFVLMQACQDMLMASEHASVINISSIYGVLGPDMRLYDGTEMGVGVPAAYAASKGGVLQLTRWLATVLAPKIRVNAITLGGVWRNQPESFHERYIDRTPLGRMATEEDIKGAVTYLASDLSNYVTGENLVVDGGWTAW